MIYWRNDITFHIMDIGDFPDTGNIANTVNIENIADFFG